MNISRFGFLLVLLFVLTCNTAAQQLSTAELMDILGIMHWRVPMSKDTNMEWTIELVDYTPRKYTTVSTRKLSTRKKALIALRDVGRDVYAFTLKQSGISQGNLEINICTEQEKHENECDNSYDIEWNDVAKPYADGTKFVIADLKQMIDQRPRKQIILELVHFRLEDMIKENTGRSKR
jgi:hypothetical protein